jgi:hypothetical protein
MKTKTEQLWDITAKYRAAGERWPATAKDIAAWAIREKLWQPQPRSMIDQCAAEIAAAMREQYVTDPQGRRVRKNYVIRDVNDLKEGKHEQTMLWLVGTEAKAEEMDLAFRYKRRLILGDCTQLKTEVDSYNENNRHNAHFDMCFNFEPDLAESAQPVEYPAYAGVHED